jgi:hypothetical protein
MTRMRRYRRFLLNPGVITSVAGGIGVLKKTREGPRDLRLALLWASWAVGVGLAVAAVEKKDEEVRQEELERELKKIAKGR